MYKDKDKQREANRKAQARFKAKTKGITNAPPSGITGQGITEEEFIEQVAEIFDVPTGLKRGKDIKCFADLSPDVQETINMVSENEHEHKVRTAIAINYQHEFPDRYYSTGVTTSGWKDEWRQQHERKGVACLNGERSVEDNGQG